MLRRALKPLKFVSAVLAAVLVGLGAAHLVLPEAASEGGAACSAAALPPPAAQAGLPQSVDRMRETVVAAARTCDHERLTRLVGEGTAERWRIAEERGEPALAQLVETLSLPYDHVDEGGETVYVWPMHYSGPSIGERVRISASGRWLNGPVAD